MLDLLSRPSDLDANAYGQGTILSYSAAHKMWRVRFKSTDWFGVTDEPTSFQIGDPVRVVGYLSSTKLLIEPD